MRRILAEVVETTDLSGEPADTGGGLPWRRVRCLVKLISSIPEVHRLPSDLKDSTCTIERERLFESEYPAGAKIILTPEECRPVVSRSADIPSPSSLRGRVVTYRTDINGDGFTERVVENAFLRVVIGPHFGARIWEMWHRRRASSPLAGNYAFISDWVEMGGQSDHVQEVGGGDLWSSEFVEKDVSMDGGFSATYECVWEKMKGITVIKQIAVPVDRPVVSWRITFKYSGAEKPPEDGRPDEAELSYKPRTSIAIDDVSHASNLTVIPTATRLRRIRHARDRSQPLVFGVTRPYFVSCNEDTGFCLARIFDNADTRHVYVGCNNGLTVIEPTMNTVKIPRDGEKSFGLALVAADAVFADEGRMALAAIGPEEGGQAPLFLLSAGEPAGWTGQPEGMEFSEARYSDAPTVQEALWWGNAEEAARAVGLQGGGLSFGGDQ